MATDFLNRKFKDISRSFQVVSLNFKETKNDVSTFFGLGGWGANRASVLWIWDPVEQYELASGVWDEAPESS